MQAKYSLLELHEKFLNEIDSIHPLVEVAGHPFMTSEVVRWNKELFDRLFQEWLEDLLQYEEKFNQYYE